MPLEYAMAITMIAPMSSITATPRRNAQMACGTLLRSTDSTASAKATSVAIGIPQPASTGVPALMAK